MIGSSLSSSSALFSLSLLVPLRLVSSSSKGRDGCLLTHVRVLFIGSLSGRQPLQRRTFLGCLHGYLDSVRSELDSIDYSNSSR